MPAIVVLQKYQHFRLCTKGSVQQVLPLNLVFEHARNYCAHCVLQHLCMCLDSSFKSHRVVGSNKVLLYLQNNILQVIVLFFCIIRECKVMPIHPLTTLEYKEYYSLIIERFILEVIGIYLQSFIKCRCLEMHCTLALHSHIYKYSL